MKRSLRYRLTLSLVVVLAMVLIALSSVLHAVFERALRRQFDSRLLGDAAAVAGMAEDDASWPEFEYQSLPEFERAERPAYFEAWLEDGKVLARSPSLGGRELSEPPGRVDEPQLVDMVLPDGRTGRAIYLRQPLRIDVPAGPGEHLAGQSSRFVTVVVARATEELVETLTSVRRWLFLLGLLGLTGASGAALLAVSRALRPTIVLAGEIGRLNATRLHRVLPTDDLPAELVPVISKVNDLLARLSESFARERRFTSDVSHELRTPLAALRTTLEVTTSRERTATEYRTALEQVHVVVRQLQSLCENLLTLARFDADPEAVRREEIDLQALVHDCWRPFEPTARQRRLSFHNEVGISTIVVSDPDRLRIVISNLLSNAAAYTEAGGSIRVRGAAAEGHSLSLLEVYDSGPAIPEDVLPQVFERFFRADSARADGAHYGIGLALVKSVVDTLGFSVGARNTEDGGVVFTVQPRSS